MSKILVMFPGQGSQCTGMSRGLLEKFPGISKETFEEASDVAGFSIRRLCLEGSEAELLRTSNTQPSILTVSVAAWRVIKEETGIEPAFFAGHSLGEYSALVAAGILDFAQAIRLVCERGKAMERAVAENIGIMAAIRGCPVDTLENRCREMSRDGHYVQIAAYNSDTQQVIAGHGAAVEALCARLQEESEYIFAIPIKVNAPFHTTLMTPAREEIRPLLEETTFTNNGAQIIANVTGGLVERYGSSYLIEQIDNPVYWLQGLHTAQAFGADMYLDVGPKNTLYSFARTSMVPKEKRIAAWGDIHKAIDALQFL